MKKGKSKEYEIDSLEKLLNVITKENAPILIVDVAKWLFSYSDIMHKIRQGNPEYKNKLNSEICKSSFIWIDDGKNDVTRGRLINQSTGEITYYDIKKKKSKNNFTPNQPLNKNKLKNEKHRTAN